MSLAGDIRTLVAVPLTTLGFAAFGQVIEVPERKGRAINRGMAMRFDDVADVVLSNSGGRPQLSVFRVSPATWPVRIRELERHPLSSQAFMPLDGRPFLIVVAPAADQPDAGAVRAYLSNGSQGVNYAAGVWHAPVVAFGAETDFLVLGRSGPGADHDVASLGLDIEITLNPIGAD